MANPAQAPDLEGLHREIHDMAEQMRIMNENNGRLMQLLAAANPPLPAAPFVPEVERSRHSNCSGNRSKNISADQVGRGRRQAPSSSLREKSSSESSKTPTRLRGRSPRKGDHVRARDKSTSQKIRDLDARLDAINTGVGAPVTVDTLIKTDRTAVHREDIEGSDFIKVQAPRPTRYVRRKNRPDGPPGLVQQESDVAPRLLGRDYVQSVLRHSEGTRQVMVSKTVARDH
ncbi:hypothetical protein Acr_24g0004150 [Actinidia rufa]|uniref:Uncharacterized protein n=1 Tax=Actinidia rufa TaxID=165716 RepID=A0A7J0GTQ0_9ERIC|nr:hypothetical protein Acr_24g0004150 [Actinidia rufa]